MTDTRTGWIRLGDGHRCELPDDWAHQPDASIWRCPTCRQKWRVRTYASGGGRAEPITLMDLLGEAILGTGPKRGAAPSTPALDEPDGGR